MAKHTLSLRLYIFVVVLFNLDLQIICSPLDLKSIHSKFDPDEIHTQQSKQEKETVWSALIRLEEETASRNHRTLKKGVSQYMDYLFEGDIVLRAREAIELAERASRRHRRKMTAYESKLWKLPIRYKFDVKGKNIHNEFEKEEIRKAIGQWESVTCVTFTEVPVSFKSSTAEPILLFKKDNGCFSYVGKEKKEIEQEISIGEGCFNIGTIVHEIGHAIGFWHEQSRPDRDDHVIVRKENMKFGKDYNFIKESWRDVVSKGVSYDVGSIMHYKSTEYSYNGEAQTLQTIDPLLQRVPGQRIALSFYDTKLANLAYCNEKCGSELNNNKCLHDGYTDPLNCKRCRCPDGLHGTHCQTVQPYTHKPCGGILRINDTETYTIESPDFPTSFLPGQTCNWLIKVEKGKNVRLDILTKNFMFNPNCSDSVLTACTTDYLEVKYNSSFGVTGARFCCKTAPQEAIISDGNEMLVLFRSQHGGFGGFQANVSAESCGGCTSKLPEEQQACTRKINTVCEQKWVERVQEKCPVMFLAPGANCGDYISKTEMRNVTCQKVEKYCCDSRKLINGKCIVSKDVIVKPPSSKPKDKVEGEAFTYSNNGQNDINNDVKMGWSEWIETSPCSHKCGGCGQKRQRRTCDYPTTCGGKKKEEKTLACNQQRCPNKIEKVYLCNKTKTIRYRCDFFWQVRTCTRKQTVLEVCRSSSYCCQGYKQQRNGMCTKDGT